MRQIYRTNPWLTLSILTLFTVAFVTLLITYGSNTLPLLSLPSSPWSTFSTIPTTITATSLNLPVSMSANPKTALYPSFTSEKMNRAVSELVKELNEESASRREAKKIKIEAGLSRARALIRDASYNTLRVNHSRSSSSSTDHFLHHHYYNYVPHGDIYNNPYVFHRSYSMMEKLFKIYVYEEGEPPLFHDGPHKDIYSTEGVFISLLESDTKFRIRDPDQAHVYFLPFSVTMIIDHLFDPIVRDKAVLGRVIGDYIKIISARYPFWNRSLGSDHFMLSCHDWGPRATWYDHHLYFTSIRLLCNANTSEFFNPRKDVSIPEINIRYGENAAPIGGSFARNRTTLAFFAGSQSHGKIRPVLFEHWEDKDDAIRVYEKVPENISYEEMMRTSRFCICPSGYEVATARIVEAIYAECVPVLILQHYIPPFSDILNWDAFSVQVSVSEIPNLKRILTGISYEKYLKMHDNVKRVKLHFTLNNPPKRYDVFHMILHSLWLRRLNLQIYA